MICYLFVNDLYHPHKALILRVIYPVRFYTGSLLLFNMQIKPMNA